tara:strand:+ start:436 stop:900 length:465 start_codon:yes stop_codon:yes gene_type:complete
MRITENQLRKIIKEQVQAPGLTHRQKRYLSNSVVTDEFGEVLSDSFHIGTIYDDNDRDDNPTPFDNNLWVFKVTQEMADKAYNETTVYKKGPVTIPTGWFWENISDYGGMVEVKGPFRSRQEATSDCLNGHSDVITSDSIETTENANSSEEFGF